MSQDDKETLAAFGFVAFILGILCLAIWAAVWADGRNKYYDNYCPTHYGKEWYRVKQYQAADFCATNDGREIYPKDWK